MNLLNRQQYDAMIDYLGAQFLSGKLRRLFPDSGESTGESSGAGGMSVHDIDGTYHSPKSTLTLTTKLTAPEVDTASGDLTLDPASGAVAADGWLTMGQRVAFSGAAGQHACMAFNAYADLAGAWHQMAAGAAMWVFQAQTGGFFWYKAADNPTVTLDDVLRADWDAGGSTRLHFHKPSLGINMYLYATPNDKESCGIWWSGLATDATRYGEIGIWGAGDSAYAACLWKDSGSLRGGLHCNGENAITGGDLNEWSQISTVGTADADGTDNYMLFNCRSGPIVLFPDSKNGTYRELLPYTGTNIDLGSPTRPFRYNTLANPGGLRLQDAGTSPQKYLIIGSDSTTMFTADRNLTIDVDNADRILKITADTVLSGTPLANPMDTLGDIIYGGVAGVPTKLAGAAGWLKSSGAAAPAWTAIADGDLPAALTGKTYNGLTPTALATGFTLAGGTTSKTLTVELDSLVNQDLTSDAGPTFDHAHLTTLVVSKTTAGGMATFYNSDITAGSQGFSLGASAGSRYDVYRNGATGPLTFAGTQNNYTGYLFADEDALTLAAFGAVAGGSASRGMAINVGVQIGTATIPSAAGLGVGTAPLGAGQIATSAGITCGGTLTIADAQNMAVGTGTGTKIGTATDQKLAFFNSAPIVQPSGDILTALSNLGLVASPTITRIITVKVIADATALATGDGQATFVIPVELNGKNLVSVGDHVFTASTSGLPTIQLRNVTDSVDMLSTRLTIDENEVDSATAATAAVIDTTKDDVATGDVIAIDVDVAGTGTKGLEVRCGFA